MSAYDLSSGNAGYPGLQRLMRKTTMSTDRPMTSPSVRECEQTKRLIVFPSCAEIFSEVRQWWDEIRELSRRLDTLESILSQGRTPRDPDAEEKRKKWDWAAFEADEIVNAIEVAHGGEVFIGDGYAPGDDLRMAIASALRSARPSVEEGEAAAAQELLTDKPFWEETWMKMLRAVWMLENPDEAEGASLAEVCEYDPWEGLRQIESRLKSSCESSPSPPTPGKEGDWAKDAAELIFDDQPKQPRSWNGDWEYRHAPYATKVEADEARQRCMGRAADIIRAAYERGRASTEIVLPKYEFQGTYEYDGFERAIKELRALNPSAHFVESPPAQEGQK